MYLTYHSALKTETIGAVIGECDVVTKSFGCATVSIFVAGDNSSLYWGKAVGKIMTKSGKNEIQELHAKEVGVGNPSEERASS